MAVRELTFSSADTLTQSELVRTTPVPLGGRNLRPAKRAIYTTVWGGAMSQLNALGAHTIFGPMTGAAVLLTCSAPSGPVAAVSSMQPGEGATGPKST